ncbi:MAG: trypsin-like peptidase domain-containing protein [Candidatus Pacebacteria bacterium]|nr:trypsin-like peptidase domain-containing protein [Candidatus Paceibacterota bacterium]MDD4074033.1 trypsin-like peptidase domain-containing protein [Candidatus Paceibacterota bacterium]
MNNIYKLPELNIKKSNGLFLILIFILGFIGGLSASYLFYLKIKQEFTIVSEAPVVYSEKVIETEYIPQTTEEEKIIAVVKENSPSVVSIVLYKDITFLLPTSEEKQQRSQVSAGTGFIVSEDGMILTNKHVISDEEAEYVVIMNNGDEYNAKVLAKDPVQDLAILKIEGEEKFSALKLGTVDEIQIGQIVIAIGNALGRYQNTVSVGVVSGLGRTVIASGADLTVEKLEDIIQTDAAINKGNSGGPLINLNGEVVGINTAVSVEGQGIGFAISIDKALRDIEQVKTIGKISYPYIGVRYFSLNKEISKENDISVDYGAWIYSSGTDPAIVPDSPAEKSGIKEGDIILEVNGEEITEENSLAKIIFKYNPFQSVNLKILRDKEIIYLNLILDEWKE